MTAPEDARPGRLGDVPWGQLTLYVAGASELSVRAIADARALCDVHLDGGCRLAVIDVHEDPGAALTSQVMVVPTLVKSLPRPERRLAGDLSNVAKVLRALELPTVGTPAGPEG